MSTEIRDFSLSWRFGTKSLQSYQLFLVGARSRSYSSGESAIAADTDQDFDQPLATI